MTWWQLFKQEWLDIIKNDPRRIIFIMGASLAYLLIFGILYSPQIVNNIPIGICDEDQTALSRDLIQTLQDSERLHIVAITHESECLRELERGNIAGMIYIPQNFSRSIKSGIQSKILLTIDGSNLVTTNILTSSIQPIVDNLIKKVASNILNYELPLKVNTVGKVIPLQASYRVLYNPTESYLYFFVLGLVMAAFQQGLFLATGAGLLSPGQKIPRTSYRALIHYYSAKLLPYGICSILAFSLATSSAIYLFHFPAIFSTWQLALLAITFTLAALSFTFFLTTFTTNELYFTRISVIYTVPAFILSGYTWPLQSMDLIGKFLSQIFPLSYLSNSYREIILAGQSPDIYKNAIILCSLAFILFSYSLYSYRHQLTKN